MSGIGLAELRAGLEWALQVHYRRYEGLLLHSPMGGIQMFEVLILITVFGLLYVEIIEILEKCEHVHAHATREIRSTY